MGKSDNEKEEEARLLAYLQTPSEEAKSEADELADIRDNLFRQTSWKGPPGPRPGSITDGIVRLFLPPTRRAKGRDWCDARRWRQEWTWAGFTRAEDIRPWLFAGAAPDEAGIVADLVSEGIVPARAGVQFEHPVTGERGTILDVARREYDRSDFYRLSLSDALDEAGVERKRKPKPSGRWPGVG